ncbi:MAG: hypothetical protein Q7U39_07435 [Nitrospira sp.]|nr:hypothetical protein [Nitrospira sp.]
MGLDVNIITGNLGQAIHTEDLLEYVREGLTSAGLKVGYSQTDYLTHGINILVEHPFGAVYDQLYVMRKLLPHSKLFMIVTELLTPSGFNSSNSKQTGRINPEDHYDDAKYWTNRTREFMRFVPVVDGFIMVGLHKVRGILPAGYEEGVTSYFQLGKPVHLVPLCHPPAQSRPTASVRRREKDIDILFTGTLTPYRIKVLDELRSRNFTVVALEAHIPAYLRNDYIDRCKLSLGLKLSKETKILSTMRAYYHLVHRIPHVFERTSIRSPLDPFINVVDSGQPFIAVCAELLSGMREFPEQRFQEFQHSQVFNYQNTFAELGSLLTGKSRQYVSEENGHEDITLERHTAAYRR